jgi:N6-L-threonylcarbamoyladenine synthase
MCSKNNFQNKKNCFKKEKICLGIESTAHTFGVGIINSSGKILANSKKQFVSEYGGMKPYEVSLHHYNCAIDVLKEALNSASLHMSDIDVVSFSLGPGMGPSLSVCATLARTLSIKYNKPIVGVNHCVAHIEIAKTLTKCSDPLVIFVSGANTQIIAKDGNRYKIVGETLDVGLGNLLDSFARVLGFGFPGGPVLDKLYFQGNPDNYIDLPYSVKGMDLAFSGLLTAGTKLVKENKQKKFFNENDIIYSFVHTAYSMLLEVVDRALSYTKKKELIVIGGVAASKALSSMLEKLCKQNKVKLYIPPMVVCLDNGVIISDLGLKYYLHNKTHTLDQTISNAKFRTNEAIVYW